MPPVPTSLVARPEAVKMGGMGVRADCRHYSTRSTPDGDVMQRCRLGANEQMPFACPEGCLFFEPRSITDAGWSRLEDPEDDV